MKYVANLTPAQEAAHRRIQALQKVYDAARKVAAKDEVVSMFPDDYDAQNSFDEAMGSLHAALWNTASELKEPYPFDASEVAA